MPRFARLQDRLNRAVMTHLPNVIATIAGGESVQAIFDREYELMQVGDGMAATVPALTVQTSVVPASYHRAMVVVVEGDVSSYWRIAEHHPDGTGMSVLLLERA